MKHTRKTEIVNHDVTGSVAMSHRMVCDRERKNCTNIHMKQNNITEVVETAVTVLLSLVLSGHILHVFTYVPISIFRYVRCLMHTYTFKDIFS